MSVIEISKENIDAEIFRSNVPVVIDFWGPKCGPCIAMMPKYHELADNPKYHGRCKFCSVDTSTNRRAAVTLRVMNLPTFLFYKDGKEAARISGNNAVIGAVAAKIEELLA